MTADIVAFPKPQQPRSVREMRNAKLAAALAEHHERQLKLTRDAEDRARFQTAVGED